MLSDYFQDQKDNNQLRIFCHKTILNHQLFYLILSHINAIELESSLVIPNLFYQGLFKSFYIDLQQATFSINLNSLFLKTLSHRTILKIYQTFSTMGKTDKPLFWHNYLQTLKLRTLFDHHCEELSD